MKMAVKGGKKTRPDIKLGICGEHGGEPSSVEFCHMIGLSYVSCSPFRLPIARLAAALNIALHYISVISGNVIPNLHPLQPNIGLNSCNSFILFLRIEASIFIS